VSEGPFSGGAVLCGHRGSGAGPAENTPASFRAAVAGGLPWVEVDARLTRDGILVARHDPVVADGRFVADLDAGETDDLGLMRVAALLEALPPGIGVDVDVKSALEDARRPRERTTAAEVARLLAPEAGRRPLLATSFDPAAVLIVRERAPAVPVGLLTWTRFPLRKAIPAAVHLGADVLAAHFASFPLPGDAVARLERTLEQTLATARAAGLQVAAWCPPPAEAALLAGAGIDCLVLDEPAWRSLAEPRIR
jgi:glycerophosphoryl diester phosphodiesterase